MILTPLALADVPAALAAFGACLDEGSLAQRVFQRIAASLDHVAGSDIALSDDIRHHGDALHLLKRFGLDAVDRPPSDGLTWDGRAVSIRMEPSVIIHEVAHYQMAAPDRRPLPDFGLGAGPESGDKATAEAARRLGGMACEREESLASLLGVLWEADLGQPAVLAFLEQNWLEGGACPHNRAHFLKMVDQLWAWGFIDSEGRPTMALRTVADKDHNA